MSRPLFSCVIPVKGERPFFKDAPASLEAQGLGEDLEVIVQDGDVDSRVEVEMGRVDSRVEHVERVEGEWPCRGGEWEMEEVVVGSCSRK